MGEGMSMEEGAPINARDHWLLINSAVHNYFTLKRDLGYHIGPKDVEAFSNNLDRLSKAWQSIKGTTVEKTLLESKGEIIMTGTRTVYKECVTDAIDHAKEIEGDIQNGYISLGRLELWGKELECLSTLLRNSKQTFEVNNDLYLALYDSIFDLGIAKDALVRRIKNIDMPIFRGNGTTIRIVSK